LREACERQSISTMPDLVRCGQPGYVPTEAALYFQQYHEALGRIAFGEKAIRAK
jgi:hypothetical protein